jgi:probable HAF family extracellular repeat protein
MKNFILRSIMSLVVTIMISLTFFQPANAQEYEIEDLGYLEGHTSKGKAINDRGHIVGSIGYITPPYGSAFLWTEKNGMVDLGNLYG